MTSHFDGDSDASTPRPSYQVYPRSDCEDQYAVVAPNGCALPLRPLWKNEAEFLVNTLNVFVEELP